jgi:hypothetical protein
MVMNNEVRNTISLSILLLITAASLAGQERILDSFENGDGWNPVKADGVNTGISVDKGWNGNAIRFDYDFTKGTGYGGLQKWFPIDLPENFEFTFYIKATSPANNFEIKFIDSSGNNVWWVNNRNYSFPGEWKKIRIRKRHISFAWGPTDDRDLKRIDRIEFTIASFVGGKGTLWIDDLRFEPLPPERQSYPTPCVTATSSLKSHPPDRMIDNLPDTYWQGKGNRDQEVIVDFTTKREFGVLHIDWMKDRFAKQFDISFSDDATNWEKVYTVQSNQGAVSFIRLTEAETRFLKISLPATGEKEGPAISGLEFPDIRNSLTTNDFLKYAAQHSPVGDYPRYFYGQASYWTVTGVNNDVREALINEDGMVEVDKARFSIEPMIKTGDSLYNWSNVKAEQTMGLSADGRQFEMLPTVTWNCGNLKFTTHTTAFGEANKSSRLAIRYSFENRSDQPVDFNLFLLIRPFQVNPYYQFLNLTGGAGRIQSIHDMNGRIVAVDNKIICPQQKYDAFGVCGFDEANPVDLIRKGIVPLSKTLDDENGLANGIMKYDFHLGPHQSDGFFLTVPFYEGTMAEATCYDENTPAECNKAVDFWNKKTGHIQFNLPASADRIVNTYRANLAYILINRDKAGIQPGSRSYERSWIRDGALTSSALLKSGIVDEVKDFINWYTSHQYENGKVPCVVDFRGPDPVPENDSHGEMIYLIREYFNFTKDTAFLREKNENVIRAVNYIQSLIAQRSTDHYKYGNDSLRAIYGLVPESISHEGYSAKPMHSYWDDFFIMKGLKDAVEIQKILGEKDQYMRMKGICDTFRINLYSSLQLAMKNKGIDYIPGCAELGDFDATSTTIALTPCNELNNLPKPQVYNTFDRYFQNFRERRDGEINWVNYTPYENRLTGSFIMLDQPDRAHELIEFFLDCRRPLGWDQWPEVVWKDYRTPQFIGDMPHTWVGSDFINAIRNMFVYEDEADQSLVLASALYQDWIDTPGGMSVENLPTYYGEISYAVKKEENRYRFSLYGDVKIPARGICIRNFNGSKLPAKVVINGHDTGDFNNREIRIHVFPADVDIYY